MAVKHYRCYKEVCGVSEEEYDYLRKVLEGSGRFQRGPEGSRSLEDKLVLWLSKYVVGSSTIRVSRCGRGHMRHSLTQYIRTRSSLETLTGRTCSQSSIW